MSITPTWEALSEKERVRWLLEHVMGHYILPDSACVYGYLDIPKGLEGFHWPIGYWDGPIDAWYTQDIAEHSDIFAPLYDMNDAWALIKRLVELYGDDSATDTHGYLVKQEFLTLMGVTSYEMSISVAHLATWTPVRICEAVYSAVQEK